MNTNNETPSNVASKAVEPDKIEQLEELCSEFEERFGPLPDQMNDLQKKLKDVQKKLDDIEKTLKAFESSKREIERLGKNVEKMQNEAAKLKSLKSEMNQLAEDLKSDISDTNIKIEKVQTLAPQENNTDWQRNMEKELNAVQSNLEKLLAIHIEDRQEQDIKSPKEKFRVEIAPANGDEYRVILSHPLSKSQKSIKGLDTEAITEFFRDHLPELDEPAELDIKKDMAEKEQPAPSTKPRTEKSANTAQRHGIEKVSVFQSKGKSGQLESTKSFSVETFINLSKAPDEKDLSRDIPVIGLSCSILNKQTNKEVFTQNFEEQLRPGDTNYHSIHKLPPLNPGAYSLNLFAFVPFDHIADQRVTDIVVN